MGCTTGAEKEKSPEEEEESQPRVPCTIEGHSAVTSEIEKLMANKTDRDAAGFIEPVRRGRTRMVRHRCVGLGVFFCSAVLCSKWMQEQNLVPSHIETGPSSPLLKCVFSSSYHSPPIPPPPLFFLLPFFCISHEVHCC